MSLTRLWGFAIHILIYKMLIFSSWPLYKYIIAKPASVYEPQAVTSFYKPFTSCYRACCKLAKHLQAYARQVFFKHVASLRQLNSRFFWIGSYKHIFYYKHNFLKSINAFQNDFFNNYLSFFFVFSFKIDLIYIFILPITLVKHKK